MMTEFRKSGIDIVGDIPWGAHFCHFYETKEDLLDILIPYFRTGLENNEFCMWIVFPPHSEEEMKEALRGSIPGIDRHLAAGDMEIMSHEQWYLQHGAMDLFRVIEGWHEKLAQALGRGYAGMRVNGNEAWLTKKDWEDFSAYEEKLNGLIADRRLIILCTYLLASMRAEEVFDVTRTHQFAIARRRGNWQVLESPELKQAKAQMKRLNEELELRVIERTSELAASNRELSREIAERTRAEKEKEKMKTQFFQAQKMESIGRLAGGVAHDFNNMLAVIIGHAEMALLRENSANPLRNDLQQILVAANRSAQMTRQLLAFARKQTINPKMLDLNDAISGMISILRRLISENIELVWKPSHNLWKVKVDPSQIDQILFNLAINARDAISGNGSITLMTKNVEVDDSYAADRPGFAPGKHVLLTVSDTGSGMDKEVFDHLFEPFFTTKELGKGTGLGLATVYGIVKQNDGFIYVESEPGKGTTFQIYLPRLETEPAGTLDREVNRTPLGGTETILLTEDDEALLTMCEGMLEHLGYTVLSARSAKEAIDLAGTHPGDIHLLIADVVMPEIDGRELAERLQASRPNLKCLYMSGYPSEVIAHQDILNEGVHFIQKPFMLFELSKKVREVLD